MKLRGPLLTIAFCACAAYDAVDANQIIERSVAANAADFRAQPGYSFLERDRENDGTRTYHVQMIEGSPYRELVAVNGRPLSPEARAKEDQKLKDETGKRRSQSPDERRDRIRKYEHDRQRDQAMMQELTKAFTFQLTGKRKLNGFQCYVLAASPRPGYRPPNRDTQALTGMEGRLWIDQKSFQWVKVEAKVVHPVAIEGFLASVRPGTRFELEKTPVSDGVWLPKHFAMHANARILGLFSHKSREEENYFDYRR